MKKVICPYPGLRPFTEEESIFFKGRDLHIRQIVKQLEENKMAFITGASGDGKSSMVYAGVVPYIRAGFSKAKFNSWAVVDFKPQRNPLESLALSTAKELQIPYETTLNKMRRGFSALVNIYKQSNCYDENKNSSQGKNILIIADQFEEVFTMNENFHNGTPSTDTYTCVNILLETIRLSIIEELPIYVIFTMRSDYISQCTVFKDLPEFIAYSQFFVPQLKRTEIRQVIEQPAILAGGSVSTRLTEVLINNLNSGFDQLPVLQHALNLLWKTADNGSQTLDIIHMAKIAGISKEMLDDNERKEFNSWYAKLPDYRKKYFEKPDLNNVLNAHAGILYESSYDYYLHNADWAKKTITAEESKQIIKTAFTSLTKIDNNRQVRNRCSLGEITGIINKPNINNATVCAVLNIFRAEGNTLLRPFANGDDIKSQYLSANTVLDITHEALIRNWKMLSDWDKEELININEYNDFNSQVQRWLDNSRSPEFLLTSGNYAIFKQWYDKCRPNPYWILKNDNTYRSEQEKLNSAINRMEVCDNYMQQSREAILAKEKARRRKLVSTIIGLLVFIVGLLIFALWARSAQKDAEVQKLEAEAQKKEAENQKDIADKQRLIAEKQSEAAVNAQIEAQQQRDTARIMYQRALAAKNESDMARLQAEDAKNEAEQMRKRAEDNYKLAEQERQNTLNQMNLTKQASDSANKLYYVALCNTLAMKAKNQYEDKTLNLRLAKTACEMNRKGGANSKNADLYDAMLFAMEQNKLIRPMTLQSDDIQTITVDDNGVIRTFDHNGTISQYAISNSGEPIEINRVANYENKIPVETAIFVNPTSIVYTAKDRKSYFIDLTGQKQTKLSFEDDYIKTASILSGQKKCAVACAYGKAAVINTDNGSIESENDFNAKITDIYFLDDSNVYVLIHNGRLVKWNFKTGSITEILSASDKEKAFCMEAIEDKNLLAVCFSDGAIQFLNLQDGKKINKMAGGHSKLDNVIYDHNTGILAISSADKRISLVNTNDFSEKPLVIEEHSLDNHKVKGMGFNKQGVLFVLTDDNKLRLWDTNPDTYSATLSTMNLAPLSETEWNLILGRDFSVK